MAGKEKKKPRTPAKPKKAKGAKKARKAKGRGKAPTGAQRPQRQALTGQEREGMGLVCDLINAQFASNGNLADCTPWVRGLSDSQRRALLAADRRIKKAAGR
jgi:hypothetical protein